MDYLNPEANKLFDQWTFDAYKQAIGDELGKTVLGFRGDEPSFGFNPWSPVILAEFQKRKGYDLRPYLATIASINIGGGRGARCARRRESRREPPRLRRLLRRLVRSLRRKFLRHAKANGAPTNHVEMQTHIEHEENLPQLATADGDFFKCMRSIQVPGIDTIWHQIWHDVVADFPKLASSATHLNGHPRAMCEAFAAYNPVPDLKEAGWILNHLMVHGINRIEYMGLQGTGPFRGFYGDPGFPAVSAHVNRACYLLGEGRPAAQIGVYIPSSSFWFNDAAANTAFLAIVHQLLQHQRDLDFVDEYALSKTLKLQGNGTGQPERPGVSRHSGSARGRDFQGRAGQPARLRQSRRQGHLLRQRAQAGHGQELSHRHRPGGHQLGHAGAGESKSPPRFWRRCPRRMWRPTRPTWLKYNHRRMKDADLYFFFNEGEQPLSLKTTVANSGTARQAQHWDTTTGKIEPWAGATFANGKTTLPLELPAWGTKIVVVCASAASAAALR